LTTIDDKEDDMEKDAWKKEVEDFIRLFRYVIEVGKEIGEDKAWEIYERVGTQKKLKWIDENRDKIDSSKQDSSKSILKNAFNIFYFGYLGLKLPQDGEIVEESENKIVSRWWNPCPVLEACKALGLNTRVICKKAYEKSPQVFLSKIDPRIKFTRNYEKIRPHAEYCEETLELVETD